MKQYTNVEERFYITNIRGEYELTVIIELKNHY